MREKSIEKEEKEARQKRLEELKKEREEEIEGLKNMYFEIRKVRNQIIQENFDALGEDLNKQINDATEARFKTFEANLRRTQELARQATETSSQQSISNLQAYAELASYAVEQFTESTVYGTTTELLGTANQFISDLQGGLDESNEEGFESAKKYKIAQVVTTGAQSSFEAFAQAQKYNAVVPGLGTAIGIALVSVPLQQSQDNLLQTLETLSLVGVVVHHLHLLVVVGATIPRAAGTFTPLGQQAEGTTLTPQFNTDGSPIRAYVVGQDVNDAQEAQARLNRRRTLGPG